MVWTTRGFLKLCLSCPHLKIERFHIKKCEFLTFLENQKIWQSGELVLYPCIFAGGQSVEPKSCPPHAFSSPLWLPPHQATNPGLASSASVSESVTPSTARAPGWRPMKATRDISVQGPEARGVSCSGWNRDGSMGVPP